MQKKYLIVDTETANGLDCPLVYDFGFAVIDETGKVYSQSSFVVADIFFDHELMSSAYYAEKVPHYIADINEGKRKLITLKDLKASVARVMAYHGIDTVIAHNARFDYSSATTTQRYMTSSKYRYFFPYGTHFVDTLKMARQVLKGDTTYRAFCVDNGYVTARNQSRFTAEILYRFITNNAEFVEAHTALEDVLIEKEIFAYCRKRNPEIDGLLWE